MKFAAVDIGSNGARLLISRVLLENTANTNFLNQISFKDIEYVRYPLRLGMDVFELGKISKKKKHRFIKLMEAFKILMDLHEVDDHMALATSAFREAENGEELAEIAREKIELNFEIIDGIREAEILSHVINKMLHDYKNYIHIDVGGGSTELNLYKGKKIIAAKSFKLGSIRNSQGEVNTQKKDYIKNWIEEQIKVLDPSVETIAIGTGGNINKAYGLINGSKKLITDDDIITLRQYLEKFTFQEKINILKLNPDRADTIYPASAIYLSCMQWAGAHQMMVPKVGLKDGMMEVMLKRNLQNYLDDSDKEIY